MNTSGCNADMLDKISMDLTGISEQISLYLSKIEDEIDNLKNCFDVSEISALKNHFYSVRNNFEIVERNIEKVATDMTRVKARYASSDDRMQTIVNRAIGDIENKEV